MLTTLLAKIGLSKTAIVAVVGAALLALASLGAWGVMHTIGGMVSEAAATARAERDAHWRAEIAASNVAVQAARAEQALLVAHAEAVAGEQTAKLQTELTELEKANAALAGGDRCGVGRDRVRLLNGAR